MKWEAANISEEKSFKDNEDRSSNSKCTETVEAALSRLTKAYSSAMSCLGTLHKLQILAEKDPANLEEVKEKSQQLALAARKAFEQAVLMDPLISKKLAPTFTKTLYTLAKNHKHDVDNYWSFIFDYRPKPVVLTSTSHQTIVRDIAYLSLLNYADLLVAAQCTQELGGNDILDKGVVKYLSLVSWEGNLIQKLALVALCDATDIDGSDPVIWLKLACAARRYSLMEREDYALLRYKRLERHALEKGMSALPENIAPNRLIVQALKEHEALGDICFPVLEETNIPQTKFVIDLPRFSWSVLGRMLMRACREAHKPDTREAFGSPCIELRISPMLILPNRSLGRICKFLHDHEIWKFEATCRGLSAAILSARAFLEREESNERIADEGKVKENKEDSSIGKIQSTENFKRESSLNTVEMRVEDSRVSNLQPIAPSRSSKRVRSQLISSGKRNERETRRNSVKFCLLASTLHIHYEEKAVDSSLMEKVDWEKIFITALGSNFGVNKANKRDSLPVENLTPDARLTGSCLSNFINQWSCENSGPFDVLKQYTIHVALNVADVFTSDQDSLALSSFMVDCVELLARKSGAYFNLNVCSFGELDLSARGKIKCLEYFAVNLLNAELRLKRSEGELPGYSGYEVDSNYIGVAVPELLEQSFFIDQVHTSLNMSKIWIGLKTRLHWLAAGFYLEKSRLSKNIPESREAEKLGIEQVEMTKKMLSMPSGDSISIVKTPHLMSPRRTGSHWKNLSFKSLSFFQDEIEASSVVSRARQNFQEKLTEIDAHWQESMDMLLNESNINGLLSIAKSLFQRYDVGSTNNNNKFEELLNDFIACCSDDISSTLETDDTQSAAADYQKKWGSLWLLAPSEAPRLDQIFELPNPSVLTILMTCWMVSGESKVPIAQLVIRLAICSFMLLIQDEKTENMQKNDDGLDYFSEDESFSDDDSLNSLNKSSSSVKRSNNHQKSSLVATVAEFFVDKISHIYCHQLKDEEKISFTNGHDCLALLKVTLTFVAEWYKPRSTRKTPLMPQTPDHKVFRSICSLKGLLNTQDEENSVHNINLAFFAGLCRVITRQRKILPIVLEPGHDNRSGRSLKQKECLNRIELVAMASCELGAILSCHLSKISNDSLIMSDIISKTVPRLIGQNDQTVLSALVESLLYFWSLVPKDAMEVGSTLERIFLDTLLVPVASAIIGLCGSAVSSCPQDCSKASKLGLVDFLDSDASANEDSAEDDERSEDENRPKRQLRNDSLLQPLCQAVHCIYLIVNRIDDKLALRYLPTTRCERSLGHIFPLIITRVLSFYADLLLSQFGVLSTPQKNLWQESYPFGTRSIGVLIDSALHKSYKMLYGITIQGHWIKPEKEKNCDDRSKPSNYPESTKAAAQLYRCIQRAYSSGRKSAPKHALECVSHALPSIEPSKRRQAMETFIFQKDTEYISPLSISRLAKNDDEWKKSFEDFFEKSNHLHNTRNMDDIDDELYVVRRGIAHQLSIAPLSKHSQANSDIKNKEAESLEKVGEERVVAAFQEHELRKKFWAILDNMCYSEPSCFQGWLLAAECLNMKADLIADRIGSSSGFLRAHDFTIKGRGTHQKKKKMPMKELLKFQKRRYLENTSNFVPFIGDDLSIFVDYQWSSFKNLEKCAWGLSNRYSLYLSKEESSAVLPEYLETNAWIEIQTMYKKKDYIGWQQAWGGIFVEALRSIALRCYMMAFFLLDKNPKIADMVLDKLSLQSEILESLGISVYLALGGKQGYGYPMHSICDFKIRELAEAAQLCFATAAKKVENDNNQVTYDLHFMTGKCFEKIAKTYSFESFPDSSNEMKTRSYEHYMENALNYYHRSLEEAESLEKEGALRDIQAGGSSHGKLEVFYRLHATRLKCLIFGVKHQGDFGDKARQESFRLVKKFWYDFGCLSENSDTTETNSIQWKMLTDIVSALAQCRQDQQFFHRSVYRHAQALMWAPVLHDQSTGFVDGSLGIVPSTKSHHIRGLNSSIACAKSAEVIMASLFCKKRNQLVSAWITTVSSSPSPFEVINSSIRKFDLLRGKYFNAYIEILELCQRSSNLETLLQIVASSNRDLPSLYQSSALAKGITPEYPHFKESMIRSNHLHTVGFLKDIKRRINQSLASIIIKESSPEDKNNSILKKSYACYLRLNTTVEEIMKTYEWKYNTESLPEIEALFQVYMSRPDSKDVRQGCSNWSGDSNKVIILRAALEKCASLFPALMNTLYRRNKAKRYSLTKVETTQDTSLSKKRLATDPSSVQFVVDVPSGLEVGQKFETTVQLGSQMKTLRLTVPVGRPSKLKFSLKLPNEDDNDDQTHKRRRVEKE